MSGICGIVALGGPEPTDGQIAALTSAMKRRGPDRLHHWREGRVALGHALLATTPEAVTEHLPLTDPASRCTITADARLDNREELFVALALTAAPETIGDGELILRAYLKWGEDCPKHLLGDFAFAIWDGTAQKLFCARDHMGMRQLIYGHVAGVAFAFATEVEALFTHPAVPRRINRGRIADFIDNLEGLDFTSTFFEQVFRLPPAHALTVVGGALSVRRYWTLQPPPPLVLPSNEAYAAAFLSVFTDAVRCRLRSAEPVGAMLSGGMDSGSVVAVAALLLGAQGAGPLRTFSAISPDCTTCVETRTIFGSVTMAGLAPTCVNVAEIEGLAADLIRLGDETSEPFDSNMTLVRAVYLTAHRAKIRVMLDGAIGDVALISSDVVAHWLRRGRFAKAWREAWGEQRFWRHRGHAVRAMTSAAWGVFAPKALQMLWRRERRRRVDRGEIDGSSIEPSFASAVQLSRRRRRFQEHMAIGRLGDALDRAQKMRHPHIVVGRERYDRVAATLAIEPRDPFVDVRLLEFCLSLPADQFQDGGWPKIILRRAMVDLLPPSTLWRVGKEHLGWTFTCRLFDFRHGWRDDVARARPRLDRLVGPSPASGVVKEQADHERFYLLRWLDRQAARGCL